MANYKVVDADKLDSALKRFADKLRAKTNTEEEIAFPDGFDTALDNVGEDLNTEITEQEALIAELKETLANKASGGSGGGSSSGGEPKKGAEVLAIYNGQLLTFQELIKMITGSKYCPTVIVVDAIPDESMGISYLVLNETGKIYMNYNDSYVPIETLAPMMGVTMPDHGWIDTEEFFELDITDSQNAGLYALRAISDPAVDGNIFEFYSDVIRVRARFLESETNSSDTVRSAITTINLPNAIWIGERAFYYSQYVKSINIPKAVWIGKYAFYNNSKFTTLDLPYAKKIDTAAFQNCHLTTVRMPKVEEIGTGAFAYCGEMQLVDCSECTKVPTLSTTGALIGIPSDCEIRVPAALYDEWIAATNWSTYADKIVAV